MSIIQNLKNYFTSKAEGKETQEAPVGICPNCWGKEEWDGEFYSLKKGNKLDGNDPTYNNFINKIVESNVSGITINSDTYECETCKVNHK